MNRVKRKWWKKKKTERELIAKKDEDEEWAVQVSRIRPPNFALTNKELKPRIGKSVPLCS